MRRSLITSASLGLLALAAIGSTGAHAQYYNQGWNGPSYEDDYRRERWREMRRARDEARIAEAARREAEQIEAERDQRRAWRRQMREQGYAPGYGQPGWSGGPAWGNKY